MTITYSVWFQHRAPSKDEKNTMQSEKEKKARYKLIITFEKMNEMFEIVYKFYTERSYKCYTGR